MRGEHLDLTDTVLYRQSEGPVELVFSQQQSPLVDGDIRPDCTRLVIERLEAPLEIVVP